MGSSSSKKKAVQQEAPKPVKPRVATPDDLFSPPPSPSPPPPPPQPLPAIQSRQSSVHNRSPSVHTRASAKRSNSNLANGIERRTPYRKLSNKTPDNVALPPISNGNYKSASRATRRSSSIAPVPPINQSRLSLESLVDQPIKQPSRMKSPSIYHSGRCSKCPHCRRIEAVVHTAATPDPDWITKDPGAVHVCIDMDKYDVEAIQDQIIEKNNHLLGSYDYEPYLVIEQVEGGYDPTKENYFTQPFIAKVEPTIEPIRTPFPDYNMLQRHEYRLNKPFSVPLFN